MSFKDIKVKMEMTVRTSSCSMPLEAEIEKRRAGYIIVYRAHIHVQLEVHDGFDMLFNWARNLQ